MKRRTIALVLALCLMTAMLASCSGSDSAAESTAAASTEAPAAEPAPAEDPAQAESPAAPEADPAPAAGGAPAGGAPDAGAPAGGAPAGGPPAGGPPADGAPAGGAPAGMPGENENIVIAESGSTIAYPLPEAITFELWKPMNSQFLQMFPSYEENICLPAIEELTNVNLDFIEPSEATSSEQFNLMIASGDYPDYLDCTTYSGGGLTGAFNDGVIHDLTDLIPVHAPDYWSAVQNSNEETARALKDDSGRMYCLYTINNVYFVERGLTIRKDWLDNLGLAVPETTTELYDAMLAIKNEYNTPYTFNIDANGNMEYVVGAWGVSGYDMFLKDGQVTSSLLEPALMDFVTYVHNMYVDGLIDPDFYSKMPGPDSRSINNESAIWYGMADQFGTDKANAIDPNFNAVGMGAIVMNKGDEYHFGDLPTMTGRANLSISTTCENLEAALQFVNWFFTDDGYEIANYGIEGESFEYVDGEPRYLDVIANNPNGWNKVNAKVYYSFWNIMPFYNAHDALLYTYEGNEVTSMEVWTGMNYDQKLPALSYLIEETAEQSTLSTEITSYAEQEILKFIVGDSEINQENWDAFTAQLKAMDIDRLIEITQGAYERYLKR